ncbi:nucleoside triphosphate pyrophosphohydrolase family protein [Candidatus Saccharibacteria bacterium TM7i]|nr:nucleoside triphosphate pyrophosphohydrolase family protein [Candidatus Saccharibacteria bacterium TM7i]
MTIEEYSKQAITTLHTDHGTSDMSATLLSQVFGLVGEGGEVAEKFKKLIRDKNGALSEEDTKEILKELGDVLWYVNSISNLLGSSLSEVAANNLEKVLSRKERGVTSGSGDNR